ncbi:MAG: CDP-glucose 4,6-dehydratase [Chloroflexi bacterium]|nr:CDP-glucose 4,6-dehydratase [Chloroflexota bacterium]
MSVAFLAPFVGRRVLITGHTGFKGSWLSLWLARHEAIIAGYALEPPTQPSNFVASRVEEVLTEHHVGDIRDGDRLAAVVDRFRPQVILHLAAQTVVLDGYATPAEAFAVNVMGTVTLLDAVRTTGVRCAIVAVSTDKVYANDESGRPFAEGDPLGGSDPYSASKAASELAVEAYRASFFPPEAIATHGVAIASARAGNVIGGGDWTPHGLVADTFRALTAGRRVVLRYPKSIRPWQHVLEPLAGYLRLASMLQGPDAAKFCRPWNFGPPHDASVSVRHVVEGLISAWGEGAWDHAPHSSTQHEAKVLRISASEARRLLGARTVWSVDEAVRRTAAWYRSSARDPAVARDACEADIMAYERAIQEADAHGGSAAMATDRHEPG